MFPCSNKIKSEQTVKMFVEQWFAPCGAPKQVHSDEDVRMRSDTGWYKRVPNALNVQVTTGVPYTHTSNPFLRETKLCGRAEPKNPDEAGKYQRLGTNAAMGCANHELSEEPVYRFHPHEVFHGGRPAWFFITPFAEEFKSPVEEWLEHKQSMANQVGTNLRHVRERELSQ